MLTPPDDTTVLRQRAARLRSAMEWSGDAIAPSVRAEVLSAIERSEERLGLGVDHTVIAFAGGTGSGKSSLFNAIVGRDFAVPGISRPTTTEMSAATWGDHATALLDWLGVAPNRRMKRDSLLDAQDQSEFAGLVLIDLPDHDSVYPEHRHIVSRVVPMADLLIWVMDPQKYADNALHAEYVAIAASQGRPSLVVLNHIDRLSHEQGWQVVLDLQRILVDDGLPDVPVLPISAKTGHGIEVLRAEIAGAAQARTIAAEAVRADLVAAGRALERALARESEPAMPDVLEMVTTLARAAGVDAVAEATARRAAGKAAKVPALPGLRVEDVERERLDWIDAATHGLPVTWHRVVRDAVAPADALADEINAALRTLTIPEPEPRSGFTSWVTRSSRANAADKDVRDMVRMVIRAVVEPLVAEPTELIHQAYRNLDELTELSSSPPAPRSRR